MDNTIGAIIKASIPATLNPGTNTEASQKHKPLITKVNAPKLRIFRGRDNKDIIGLTPELTMPITNAAIKAAGKLAKFTPVKMISTTRRLKVVAKIVKNEPNIIKFLLKLFTYNDRTLSLAYSDIK